MPRTSADDRAKRHRLLVKLLERHTAATQDEIVKRLRAAGFAVTQATVSRDLEELGAVRVHNGYELPERNGPPAGLGKKVFSEFVLDVVPSANLVVVRTYPGMAPSVGAMVDAAGIPGVIGTVAGDDTVLVVTDERTGGRMVAKRITSLGGK